MSSLSATYRTMLKANLGRMRQTISELQEAIFARAQRRACRDIRFELAALRLETAEIQHTYLHRKAGFKEDQPRWPTGSGDDSGRWSGGAGTGSGRITVTTSPGFVTGDSIIDGTSEALSKTLVRVMENLDFIPESSPQVYGIAVHAAFAMAVRLQDLPGIGYTNVERSFNLGDADPRYGLAGTIRTDVALQNDQGDVIAIYDVKTGDRRLSQARANELRTMTRATSDTPVFELNADRGISRKHWHFSLSQYPSFSDAPDAR